MHFRLALNLSSFIPPSFPSSPFQGPYGFVSIVTNINCSHFRFGRLRPSFHCLIGRRMSRNWCKSDLHWKKGRIDGSGLNCVLLSCPVLFLFPPHGCVLDFSRKFTSNLAPGLSRCKPKHFMNSFCT